MQPVGRVLGFKHHMQSFSILNSSVKRCCVSASISQAAQLWNGEDGKKYNDAVDALNNLQSNASVIQERKRTKLTQRDSLGQVYTALERLNITTSDLSRINAIHIAGTKGKGSTSAICESILRHHGYRTGFFSSPHLIEVRERIRLDGQPISKVLFTDYFWKTYNTLQDQLKDGEMMPPYFKFLSLMAFQVFLNENIDVAIIEVGIGGRYDTTNVVSNPVVCGITPLGIDHTELLGDTIEQIAWQKGGILKEGCPAVTVAQQDSAMSVLVKCAEQAACSLYQAPKFNERSIMDTLPHLGLDGDVQFTNASLAVQLCKIFMERMRDKNKWTGVTHGTAMLPLVNLNQQYIQGLQRCQWPGRFQTMKLDNTTLYLDGAHTDESVQAAFKWFMQVSSEEQGSTTPIDSGDANSIRKKTIRVLLFNKTGNRDAVTLLEHLINPHYPFDFVIFCPNIIQSHSDNKDKRTLPSVQLNAVLEHKNIWESIIQSSSTQKLTNQQQVLTLNSINATVDWLEEKALTDVRVQVLVTGSLLLVGNFLSVIKDMKENGAKF